VALQSLKVAFY